MGRTKWNDVYRGRDHSRKNTEHGALHRVHAERRRHCTWFIRQRVLRHMSRHTNRPAGVLRHSKTGAAGAAGYGGGRELVSVGLWPACKGERDQRSTVARLAARARSPNGVPFCLYKSDTQALSKVCMSVNTCASEAHCRSVSAD